MPSLSVGSSSSNRLWPSTSKLTPVVQVPDERGGAVRARAIERFSLERTADLLVELYRDVLRRG
jgi:hypothetical protein